MISVRCEKKMPPPRPDTAEAALGRGVRPPPSRPGQAAPARRERQRRPAKPANALTAVALARMRPTTAVKARKTTNHVSGPPCSNQPHCSTPAPCIIEHMHLTFSAPCAGSAAARTGANACGHGVRPGRGRPTAAHSPGTPRGDHRTWGLPSWEGQGPPDANPSARPARVQPGAIAVRDGAAVPSTPVRSSRSLARAIFASASRSRPSREARTAARMSEAMAL